MSIVTGVVTSFVGGAVAGLATQSTAQVLFGMARVCPNPFVKVLGYAGATVGTMAVGVVSSFGATAIVNTACDMIDDQTSKKVDDVLAAEL